MRAVVGPGGVCRSGARPGVLLGGRSLEVHSALGAAAARQLAATKAGKPAPPDNRNLYLVRLPQPSLRTCQVCRMWRHARHNSAPRRLKSCCRWCREGGAGWPGVVGS